MPSQNETSRPSQGLYVTMSFYLRDTVGSKSHFNYRKWIQKTEITPWMFNQMKYSSSIAIKLLNIGKDDSNILKLDKA